MLLYDGAVVIKDFRSKTSPGETGTHNDITRVKENGRRIKGFQTIRPFYFVTQKSQDENLSFLFCFH